MVAEFPRAEAARGNRVPAAIFWRGRYRAAAAGARHTSPRIAGLDVARGVAILGMFIAHAVPRPDETELLVDGRSSVLFATLAGVSLGLMTGGASPFPRERRADAVRATFIRAIVLMLLGVLLALAGSEIAIILDYYAVMFVLLLPVLFAPRWLLAVIGGVLAVGAPLFADRLPPFDSGAIDPASVVSAYLFTGYYPAVVWLPFLCIGLIFARSDITRRGTQLAMVTGGLVASAGGYAVAAVLPNVDAAAHSGTTAEIAGSGGLAVAVIGGLVLVASTAGRAGRVAKIVTWPIAAAGSMALTVYTVQVAALGIAAYVRDTTGALEYPGWPMLIALAAVTILGASVWRKYLGRGPLERMLTLVTRARLKRRPPAPPGHASPALPPTAIRPSPTPGPAPPPPSPLPSSPPPLSHLHLPPQDQI